MPGKIILLPLFLLELVVLLSNVINSTKKTEFVLTHEQEEEHKQNRA